MRLDMRGVAQRLLLVGILATLAGCVSLSTRPVGNRHVPQPVKAVDLDRYLGRWYELYRYEAPFQKDCDAVTADYSKNADGTIRVLNSCRKQAGTGPIKTAQGKARIVDSSTNAKLKVTFFWPFCGDYWVLDRDDDYQWAIIGEPSGTYLWVLSRSPKPSADTQQLLRRRAESLGYDWSLIRETRHP